jgi:hypothetical protein
LRPVGHLARSVCGAVYAAPIHGILLATERRRARAQDGLSADACVWSALAVVCLRGTA